MVTAFLQMCLVVFEVMCAQYLFLWGCFQIVNDIAPYVMCTQRECLRIWTVHFDNCTSAGRHDLAGVSQDVLQMAAVDKE